MSSERGILQTTLPWQAGLRRYVGPPFLLGVELYWAKVMFGHETVFISALKHLVENHNTKSTGDRKLDMSDISDQKPRCFANLPHSQA